MNRRLSFGLLSFLLLSIVLVLPACDRGKSSAPPKLSAQDPLWSSFISGHTTGLVSRTAKVRVLFVNDVVDANQVGQSAAGIMKVSPSVDGSISFVSPREIVLVPSKELERGKYYRVTIKAKGLQGVPAKLEAYEFLFQVLDQQFEVNVDGLSIDPSNDKLMVLKGSLVTADVEEADKIEKIVAAQFADKSLSLAWQHNADGRRHDFVVSGIERPANAQSLRLSWNGKAIGVDNKGERQIEVPAKGEFKVTQVQIVQDTQQTVHVFFSDTLDPRQNLKGLVRLDQGQSTQRIDGNVIKIYPQSAMNGNVVVSLEPGIRNAKGDRLVSAFQQTVTFVGQKPQVRFAGKGVILPENTVLSIPFEAVNVRSVRVTAFRIYENNVGQFLQTNKLDGTNELGRVGRYLWRRTIHLGSGEPDKWNRYSIDATQLFKDHPGGLFRLTLSITRADSNYACPGDAPADTVAEPPLANDDDLSVKEASSWDYYEDYYGANNDGSNWSDRENPCKAAYYQHASGVRDARNFLASNIGLLAKRDQRGKLLVVTTDLHAAKPLRGVKLSVMNFQNQLIGQVDSDANGFAELRTSSTPFYLLAEKDGQKGYLKLSSGSALPISHFDVGGDKVSGGIKGVIYGERGVWRPGDDIYLTFVLQDKDKAIPDKHPVTLELINPKGQVIQTQTNSAPVGGFYKFVMKTAADAPTGDWTAKAQLGGSTFTRTLKIETVMPNRLKLELDFGQTLLRQSDMPLNGKLFAQWLSGATAAGLKADVKARLAPVPTRFSSFTDFVFDDPAREFAGEPATLFEGNLDAQGRANFSAELELEKEAPGMMVANFASRVFEQGGAFSISHQSLSFSPYDHYVGIKLPKGDAARDMLLTDVDHTVEIASLSADGKPVSLKNLQVTLYKVDWKWWWDKSGDSLAQYASASHSAAIQQDAAATQNGKGSWKFQIKYPAWGRYLVRACDQDGGHCTGQTFYIDWPAWAGRAQEQSGPGANVLSFSADKPEYLVGETAKIKLPEATQGRALVTVENGTGILEQRWIELQKDKTAFDLPISKSMAPNVYVSVTLIQPHADKNNDRPIRLYGSIPIMVTDPQTHLKPVVKAPEEWAPESSASVEVSEANGRAMTYTVAIVDEGLLGLTSFKTPQLHQHFYKREALGVTTWDLFDDVAGAYGGELERLLSLGGSDGAPLNPEKQDKKRFPPVVTFLGPFQLKAGASAKHEFKLPQYVGAVRVMVVAGEQGAYGSTEKSVFVRQPLMLLATVPRVVGPEEELTVPVSLFVMDPSIKEVKLSLEADKHFEIVGSNTVNVPFDKPDEKLGMLRLKVRPVLGKAHLRFHASSGKHQARAEVYIDIRSANPPTVNTFRQVLKAGESWNQQVVPHGIAGTNTVNLEMSAVPPLNLERRLDYLIRYPHGCVEQVTSSVFPQLYLPKLVKLEEGRKKEIEKNVHAGIERLRGFQIPMGAFVYWPGGFWTSGGGFDARNAWSTNYVGHFIVEADKLGYHVPAQMMSDWVKYQKSAAQSWTAGSQTSVLDQSYRLYTLALANQAELGAMNRLREMGNLPSVVRWQLAAAYRLAGLPEAADALVKGDKIDIRDYAQPDFTFGSALRDRAIVMTGMLALNREAELKDMVDRISAELASDHWHSTQSVAYALLAMAKFAGNADVGDASFERSVGTGAMQKHKMAAPVATATLSDFPLAGAPVKVKNTSNRTLFASVVVRGTPKAGTETAASSGLRVSVSYTDAQGNSVDVSKLRQGQDFTAQVNVTNESSLNLENLALSQIVPSGWEIHNARLQDAPAETKAALDYEDIRDDRVYRYFGLKAGETKRFSTLLNATYLGKYYLPAVSVEAMYDASKSGRTQGQWVEVVSGK